MILRRALVRRRAPRLIASNPAAVQPTRRRSARCRPTRHGPGQPRSCGRSSISPPNTATTPCCGSPPTPGCAAGNCSACAGATSTSIERRLSVSRSLVSVSYEFARNARQDPHGAPVHRPRPGDGRRTPSVAASTAPPRIPSSTVTIPPLTCSAGPTAPRHIRNCSRTASSGWSATRPAAHPAPRPAPHPLPVLRAGVPVRVVSERLGHSTPGFTIATYHPCSGLPSCAGTASPAWDPAAARIAARAYEATVLPHLVWPGAPRSTSSSAASRVLELADLL